MRQVTVDIMNKFVWHSLFIHEMNTNLSHNPDQCDLSTDGDWQEKNRISKMYFTFADKYRYKILFLRTWNSSWKYNSHSSWQPNQLETGWTSKATNSASHSNRRCLDVDAFWRFWHFSTTQFHSGQSVVVERSQMDNVIAIQSFRSVFSCRWFASLRFIISLFLLQLLGVFFLPPPDAFAIYWTKTLQQVIVHLMNKFFFRFHFSFKILTKTCRTTLIRANRWW